MSDNLVVKCLFVCLVCGLTSQSYYGLVEKVS